MQPRQEGPAYGARTATVLALVEIVAGASVLCWIFTQGVYDESSLGTLFFLWGAIAALFGLLVPGVVLLVPSRVRWWLQPLPALLAVVIATTLLSGVLATFNKSGHH